VFAHVKCFFFAQICNQSKRQLRSFHDKISEFILQQDLLSERPFTMRAMRSLRASDFAKTLNFLKFFCKQRFVHYDFICRDI